MIYRYLKNHFLKHLFDYNHLFAENLIRVAQSLEILAKACRFLTTKCGY